MTRFSETARSPLDRPLAGAAHAASVLLALGRNAFVETIRQPIYGVLVLLTFGVLVLDLPLSGWTMGRGAAEYNQTDQQMMITLGLSTLLVSGLLISAFAAAGVLSREIEERTILTVLSKPVARGMIVIGKFLGVAAAVAVAFYLCALVLLMTIRHGVMSTSAVPYDFPVIVLGLSALAGVFVAALFCNYFFGWSFASAAVAFGVVLLTLAAGAIAFIGKGWTIIPFGMGISPAVLSAIALMLLGVLVLAAVAVAASTRLGQMMTLLVCGAFFVIGSVPHSLFGDLPAGRGMAQLSLVVWLGAVVLAALLVKAFPAARSGVDRAVYLMLWLALGGVFTLAAGPFGTIVAAGGGLESLWPWPNLTFFYALDALSLTVDCSIPLSYVALATAYAGCLIVALLAVGMALFQRRELDVRAGAGAGPRLVALWAAAARVAALLGGIAVVIDLASARPVPPALQVAASPSVVALGWVVCGWFARGVRWTYFAVFALAVAALGSGAGALAAPAVRRLLPGGGLGHAVALSAAAGLTVIMLLLPRTRHHFDPAASAPGEGVSLV